MPRGSGAALGAGHHAHAAEVAKPLADTAAGRRVTRLFESILHTAPSSQQLTQWVDNLHHGVSAKVLRNDLVAEARAQHRIQAAPAAHVTIGVGAPASAPKGSAGIRGGTLPAGLSNPRNSATGSILAASGGLRIPANHILLVFAPSATVTTTPVVAQPTSSATTAKTTATPATTTSAATSTTTSMTSTTSPTSPLTSLLATGSVPTPSGTTTTTTSGTIGTPTPLTFSPLTFSPLTFTPVTTTRSSANPSPLPTNGTLPTTNTPANPSPVPTNGELPTTNTPANPSPLPTNGTLPTTNTPANPSPVPINGELP